MRTAFLVWTALFGTGSLALPVQKEGRQQNGRPQRSPQFHPNAAFVGNFQGIPVFQQNPFFHQPVLIPDTRLFGQQAFGPVELVQFQNPGLLQQGNNQFQARNGAVEQDSINLGLNQFQFGNIPGANIRVFPNSQEVDTSNLGLNPSKPTRVILQTVPVVVEILDKTTNNTESELPGTVRTTSSFGTHRFNLGQNKEITEPVKGKLTQKPAPIEIAKALSQMMARLGLSSKIENVGKSATTEQLNSNDDNLPVPEALASLVHLGTPPSAPVTVQRKEFKKSTPISASITTEATVTKFAITEATVTKTTVTQKPRANQDKSFSGRTGEVQIPGFVAVDNMEMVLGMIGSSVVPNVEEAVPVALKQTATTTEAPVTEEPSAAEQIVLDIMSRLSSQQSENTADKVTPVASDVPKLLSGQGIVSPVIMVLSPQVGEAQDILNLQADTQQPEFVIVLDETIKSNTDESQSKNMNVGELALKIASEGTTVEVPKFKSASSAKNSIKSTNTEAVPVTDPHVDVNQNLISKRLGVASNNDVGIEHIFLKSTPVTATDNLLPSTVDTEKNATKTATVDDIMDSLRGQMIAMVSPSGTLILIPMGNLTNQQAVALTGQEGLSLANLLAATESQKEVAQTSTTAVPSTTAAPENTPEIIATPRALTGIEKIIDAMKTVQNNISLTGTPQLKSAAVKPVTQAEITEQTASATLDTLEKVIQKMEAALVNVTANNDTAEVMSMIEEVISTMDAALVNVTTGKEAQLVPQTMKTLNQAITNMTEALEALEKVTTSPLDGQQVRVVGQIVPNQGIIPQVRTAAQAAPTVPQQEAVSIRRFMTVPIASVGAQSRSGSPVVLATNVADQVASILRSRISSGVTRGAAPQIPGTAGFNQRTGAAPGLSNQPISLADQLGSEIAQHLIAIF